MLRLGIWVLLAAGCVGNIDTGGSGKEPDPGPQPPGPAMMGDPLAAGAMPMRRLTVNEYVNTVRDLLGNATLGAPDLSTDRDPGFGFRRPGIVSTLESERLRDHAETVAAAAVNNLTALLPCAPATPADEAACARKFAEQFGARAYRRPLLAPEVERLVALYQDGRTTQALPFKGGIGLMLEAMLQSAAFLYRWELGPQPAQKEGGVLRLGPYEVASRLSYFLWSTMPDKDLFDAAAGNRLGTPAQVEEQVRRMLKDAKARQGLGEFFADWLDLETLEDRSKDPKLYPEFTDALKTAMAAETRAFVTEVLFNGDGKLSTLLGASFSMVDESLAKLYGASGVTGPALRKAALDPKQRAGLFTQGSFLAVTGSPEGSNPVIRGRDIYLRVLCKELPPPPNEVPAPKPASAGGTTRQRFEEHAGQACAYACHKMFEGFGYAFERYDGIGRYRTTDNGLPVDSSGKVELDGATHAFEDARGLVDILVKSGEAQRCFATQWLRFAVRRGESTADLFSLNAAMTSFTRSGLDVRELLVGLASSRTFRYRSPNAGEMQP
jgi:hypothetical protein